MNSDSQFSTEILRGKIVNLQCRRRKQDFVLSAAQHGYMEATATGAAVAGMGASAIGLLQMSANSQEEADWVEFEVDGKLVEGWLWKMPMSEGDVVEVVAEPKFDGRYFAYSIRRTGDGVIAVYPHVTSGRSALYRRIMKYMLIAAVFCNCVVTAMMVGGGEGADWKSNFMVMGGAWVFSFMIFWILFHRAYLKMARFAKMAEIVFSCYGWRDVRNIDLSRTSKRARPANADPSEFGVHYFCYQAVSSRE